MSQNDPNRVSVRAVGPDTLIILSLIEALTMLLRSIQAHSKNLPSDYKKGQTGVRSIECCSFIHYWSPIAMLGKVCTLPLRSCSARASSTSQSRRADFTHVVGGLATF